MSVLRPHPCRVKGQTSHTHKYRLITSTEITTHAFFNTSSMFLSCCLLPVDHQLQVQSQLLCSSQCDGLNRSHSQLSLQFYLIHRPYMMLHFPWLPSKCSYTLKTVASLHSTHCMVSYGPILVVSHFAS